jgi:hypothetical protein
LFSVDARLPPPPLFASGGACAILMKLNFCYWAHRNEDKEIHDEVSCSVLPCHGCRFRGPGIVMARVQLGVKLSDDDTRDIAAFLESLTGELPAEFATAPILPSTGVAVPK